MLNPRGKVPVLKTGHAALYQSAAIIAFLDRAHPAVSLFGQTAQEHGRIWQRASEFENYTRELFDIEIVRPLLRSHAKDDPNAMHASAARVYDALGWIEHAISIAPYLAGDDITAADKVALPNIQMLRRVAARPEAVEMALGLEDLGARPPARALLMTSVKLAPGTERQAVM